MLLTIKDYVLKKNSPFETYPFFFEPKFLPEFVFLRIIPCYVFRRDLSA